jgi:hypothetical protein
MVRMVYGIEGVSLQLLDLLDGFLDDGFFLQESLQFLVLLQPFILRHLMPVGIIDLLQEVVLEAGQLGQLLAESL